MLPFTVYIKPSDLVTFLIGYAFQHLQRRALVALLHRTTLAKIDDTEYQADQDHSNKSPHFFMTLRPHVGSAILAGTRPKLAVYVIPWRPGGPRRDHALTLAPTAHTSMLPNKHIATFVYQ
jgi:hypothetical protein